MKRINRKQDHLNKSINFLEDLCWLLESNENESYGDVIKPLSILRGPANNLEHLEATSDDLIGALPRLLTDRALFGRNEDIAQFAFEVLNINILNWHKRSRMEMVGVIICQIQDDYNLAASISEALILDILDNKEQIKRYQLEVSRNSNSPFSWNDAIFNIVSRGK